MEKSLDRESSMKKAKFQSFLSNKAIKFVARINLSWRAIGVAIFCLILVACTTDAEEEFDAESVCPAEGMNAYGMPNRGTFIDERDGQEYKYTTIGNQVWMAQNLNYKTSYSMENDSIANCLDCGLFYGIAGNLPSRDMIDSVCPQGWRVPTEKDWNILLDTIGRVSEALEVLLSETWSDNKEFQGSNQCGFSLKESGYIKKDKKETYYGDYGSFMWTQTMSRPYYILNVFFYASDNNSKGIKFQEDFGPEYKYFSLRCIKN